MVVMGGFNREVDLLRFDTEIFARADVSVWIHRAVVGYFERRGVFDALSELVDGPEHRRLVDVSLVSVLSGGEVSGERVGARGAVRLLQAVDELDVERAHVRPRQLRGQRPVEQFVSSVRRVRRARQTHVMSFQFRSSHLQVLLVEFRYRYDIAERPGGRFPPVVRLAFLPWVVIVQF